MAEAGQHASSSATLRLAPDFSPLALTHLHSCCDTFCKHARAYLEQAAANPPGTLITDVTCIHNTLILLNRPGGALICDELAALINALDNASVEEADEAAQVLLLASEELRDYVAWLCQPGAIDSALPLLPLLNKCRACRGESRLSEALVLAAGIELPDKPQLTRAAVAGNCQRLAAAIRQSINKDMTQLRTWLAASTDDRQPQAARLRSRLLQFEPALILLGAYTAHQHLDCINQSLSRLATLSAPELTAERLLLVETLIRLDSALDRRCLPQSGDDGPAIEQVDEAVAACLEESRRRLHVACEDIVSVFSQPGEPALPGVITPGLQKVATDLATVEQALALLPLPEVQPVLSGVRELLTAHNAHELLPAARNELSTVMVSLEFYLGCVLPAQPAGEQLLAEAEQALSRLLQMLIADDSARQAPSTRHDTAKGGHDASDSEHDNELELDLLDAAAAVTLDNSLQQVFYRECDSHIATLSEAVERALANSSTAQLLPSESMLRALHTLTGSAQTVDARAIVSIAQPLQRAALQRQRLGQMFSRDETRFIGDLVCALQARLAAMEHSSEITADIIRIEHQLADFVEQSGAFATVPVTSPGNDPQSVPLAAVFREEANELMESLVADAVLLDDAEFSATSHAHALGVLHTFKGSARMAGFQELADRAHKLEAELQASADPGQHRRLLEQGLGELQSLQLTSRPHGSATTDSAAQKPDSLRLPEVIFERLLSLASDTSVSQARLGDGLAAVREACRDLASTAGRLRRLPLENVNIGTPAVQEMLADLDTAQHAIEDGLRSVETEQLHGSRASAGLQQALIRAQRVRLSECDARLRRVMSDAARQYDRLARFELDGGELSVDRALYRRLLASLEHLVRNAVVHGIERASSRRTAGKPEPGLVQLKANIDGAELVLSIIDDGAGIDLDRVNHQRVAAGQLPVDGLQGLRDALCEPGFSTMHDVSQVAGRGLGLSAVQQSVVELGGTLSVSTQSGQGTVITLRLPQQVVVSQVVLLQNVKTLYALPVSFVHEVRAVERSELSAQAASHTVFHGHNYKHRSLSRLLGVDTDLRPRRSSGSVHAPAREAQQVLVAAREQRLAISVDHVVGYREIIAQPLGPQLAGLQRYSGGSVLADGTQVLILDIFRLLRQSESGEGKHAGRESITPLALIVDDSITMRVAAQQTLEHRGLTTIMARDGTEALETLRQGLPDVLIVDIDMPAMNGFDLLTHLRSLHPGHNMPIIMISSRQGKQDRARARALGVTSFLGKPYDRAELITALIDCGIRLPDISIA
jgi:chemotaxis protein histidine kinase CheA/CheY-like chemotaxis protein